MSRSEIDLTRIGAVLSSYGVDYVIVGGMAVVLQGGETTTLDVDLAFDRSVENVERLASGLEELSAKPKRWVAKGFRLQPADLGSKWLHLESDSGDIDLIAEVPGLTYEAIKQGCDRFEIDGTLIQVASVKALIEIKSRTGRPKDATHLAELQGLLKLQQEDA